MGNRTLDWLNLHERLRRRSLTDAISWGAHLQMRRSIRRKRGPTLPGAFASILMRLALAGLLGWRLYMLFDPNNIAERTSLDAIAFHRYT